MRYLTITFLTLLWILGFVFLPTLTHAQNSPVVYIDASFEEVAPGSLVEVKVLSSSVAEMNAFDIVLEYSTELFSFERAYTGESVATLWKALPSASADGSISLIGGSINPWSGEGNEIVTLIFKARREGVSAFSLRKASLALADGQGTEFEAERVNQKIAVSRGASFSGSGIGLSSDTPKVASASIISDPITKNPVIVLNTQDAGNIKWLGVRSRSWLFWSDWKETQLVASIPKYAWAAQVKVLGYNGEDITTTVYRKNIAVFKFLVSLVLLMIIFLLTRHFKKRRRAFASLKIFLGFLILPALFFSFSSQASAASLTISPSGGTFSVGSTFDVQILLDTEDQKVNALDVRLTFPPDALQVVSPTAGQSIVGIWTSPPRFDNSTGEIVFQGGIPEGINVSQGLISTITFRVRRTGGAALRFSDSSRILSHDGQGTDILRQAQSGVFQFVLPPPAGPLVSSETHPDQNFWYANPNVLLRWQNAESVSGYSFILNDSPIFTPDNTINSEENFIAYKDIESGNHYFHIKALGEGGAWGGTTHFAVNLDTEPPASFPVEVRPSSRTTAKTQFIHFSTTDRYSGVDRYELSIIPLSPNNFTEEASAFQQFFIETNSPEILELDVGKYDVIVRAYDKAGNFQESVERVRVLTPFAYFATSKWTFGGGALLVIILSLAFWGVYRWHRKIGERHVKKEMPVNLKKQMEELKNYRKKYGALVLAFGILSSAMFYSPVFAQEKEITELSPPLITTLSKKISNEDIFYIGGKTENSSIDVNIFLQNLQTGETRSFTVTSDQNGDWFYRHPSFLSTGEFLLWTQSTLGELTSPPSPQVKMNITQTAIQFGSSRLSFESLFMIITILLFLVVIILSGFIFNLIRHGRRKHAALMKEIREAEEAVRRGFAVLRRDIESELAVIHKAKMNKEISSEEEQKEERLLKDLAEIESNIGKEVWDIEKYT